MKYWRIVLAPSWIIFLFLSISGANISAQQLVLTGTVIDSSTMEAVPFATVALGVDKGTISDETGYFRLPVSQVKFDDTLCVTSIGYMQERIPVFDLTFRAENRIYLNPAVYELSSVVIQGKKRRIPTAKHIIRKAIDSLIVNHAHDTSTYTGYYREYMKEDEQYVNLFESIIEYQEYLKDSLFEFNASLQFERLNRNFRMDGALLSGYDNASKYVPYSTVGTRSNNELVILSFTDPVRNNMGQTISFIDHFRTDFIRHHKFNRPRLTYLQDQPYYSISFEDKQDFVQGNSRVRGTGEIFIEAESYAIKKLHYLTILDHGAVRQKLYELTVEYQDVGGSNLLKYISYNNLFKNLEFIFTGVDIQEGDLVISFSRPVNEVKSITNENIEIAYQGKEEKFEKSLVSGYSIVLSFNETSQLGKDLKKISSLLGLKQSERNLEFKRELLSRLSIVFQDVYDIYGNPLSNERFKEYYQYREFFVHDTRIGGIEPDRLFIDIEKSVFESDYQHDLPTLDTSWLNTPLIQESILTDHILSSNKAFNHFVNTNTLLDEKNVGELVYLHLDREAYAPQDTIWFKGYIRNKKFLTTSPLSKSFFIKLIDNEGAVHWQDKFLIENSTVKGQIPVDGSLEEGIYYIAAYSSWMKNQGVEHIFSKKIHIQKEIRPEVQMMVSYDKNAYFPADTMFLQISCVDVNNSRIGDVRYRFNIAAGDQVFYRNSSTTSSEQDDRFQVVLPSILEAPPIIEIFSNYDHRGYLVDYEMPVNYFVKVDFFPEGGSLINNVESRVALKAVTRYGLPVHIEGEIRNSKGRVIKRVSTEHDGMGVFPYKPVPGDSCYLTITSPGSYNERFYLPEAKASGWQLAIQKRSGNPVVQVKNINAINDSALITVRVRDHLSYYKGFIGGRSTELRIPFENIPEGIAVITLYDHQLVPRAERLYFNMRAPHEVASVSSDKEEYGTRDPVVLTIQLQGDDLHEGSFSISVVDDQLCSSPMINEPNIISSLLLSPEIRGTIHNHQYYLDFSDALVMHHLDLLLMTQGWRNYELMTMESLKWQSKSPADQEVIRGVLMKKPFGRENEPTDGILTVFFGGGSNKIPVKKDGKFSFLPEYSIQYNSGIFLSATDRHDNPKISIVLDTDTYETELDRYLASLTDSLNEFIVPRVFTYTLFKEHFTYDIAYHQWLEEVVIRKEVKQEEFSLVDIAMLKREVPKAEIERFHTLEDIVDYYSYYFSNSEDVFFCVDGVLRYHVEVNTESLETSAASGDSGSAIGLVTVKKVPDRSVLYEIPPESIERFVMVKGWDAMSLFDVDRVIDIKLKPLSEREAFSIFKNPIQIKKFAVAKEFYTPVYESPESKMSQIPDLRKTIYWNNEIHFNEEGVARLKFYNGDRYTTVKCILEGISDHGIPVHAEYKYRINLN